jgi:hypothetical protein
MNFTKHPSYGYLTKEEYELMKNASHGNAKAFAAIAKKREAIAKRRAAEDARNKRNTTVRT